MPEGPGSLEGLGENIDVNANMGAMTYGIQVDLPKGYPEMTPAVGLTYNSGGGNTLLGVGWDMSTPFIERMTSRGLPRYDDTDLFAANGGLQLVQISGAEPAVYRARFEGGFVRFKWHDRGRGDGGRWTAELPDGRVEHYGADARGVETASARVGGDEGVFRYHLVEVVDVWGHAIRYSYRKLGTATVPVQIGYVFVEDQPRFKVEFDYEDRPDLIADLKGGFPEVLESRLSRVRVISSGVEIGRWALSYEPAQLSGGASRLAGVERFGLGLERYPAAFRFGYSRSIGGLCEGQGCERPTLVSMGRNLGINFRSGNVTLIDINGDALPDIVETPVGGAHRFLINRLTSGRQYFDDPIRSQVGQTSTHALSAGNVQVLDVDGDGFADLINTRTGEVLENKGAGDWVRRFNLFDGEGGLPDLGADLDPEDGDLASIRFFDFDNDKRIDVLKSSGQGGDNQTSIFRNLPSGGFEAVEDIESLQVGFESDQLQMSDFNGDGLLDLVQMSFDQVRVRLNRGLGRWTGWSELDDLPFSPTELLQVEMEDLNNDGLSDMVLVLPDEVRYALNVNGAGFGQPVTMNSASLGAELPPRDDTTTVLFADMNGNGSSDIVWITINGDVTFLEMFSVQPNLLSHIDNSLGFVQEITYGSSVQQAARDAEAGRPWSSKLPHAVSVVTRISTVEGFANLTDASTYEYTEGFYDGAEKAFRGFERVAISSPGGDGDEISVKRLRFDQGRSGPHRAGLELEVSHEGDAGRLLRIERRLFEDCPLEGLPPEPSLSFPIRFVCMTRSETVAVEDNPASLWATATAQFTYDGFGNVTREALLGLTDIGGEGCEPCQRDPSIQGRACGPQCLGDEQFSETEYVHPDNTGGRWILGAPSRVRNHGGSLDDLFAERTFYYDGDAFEGLPLGQLSHGALTRVSQRVDDQGGVIQTLRFRRDRHGNVLDELNPKGDPAQLQTERRAMTWDLLGLNPIQAEQHLLDDQGAPYSLRQRIDHDLLWNKPSLVSNWVVIQADRPTTPETFEAVLYDNFGRFSERFLAGDDTGDPSERLTYELASPISRVVFASRVEHGRGALDKISIRCFDGKGRKIQERTQLDDDRWLVSHYTVFNANGSVRRLYTAHVSPSGDCAAAPPEGTGYREVSYDALGRDLRHTWVTREGAASERYVHGPTTTLHFDMEDNDPSSPHFDTPTRHDYDGLGRIVGLARFTTPTEAILTEMTYDALGNFRGTLDPQGNEKIQTYDEAGRLVHIQDPDRGQTRLTLDANGQVIEEVDGAGRVIGRSYDGMGRLTARWDAADPEGTRIEHRYDFPRDCPAERCTNTAHKIVEATFPDGQGRGAEWYGYNARQQMVFEGVTVRQRTFEFLYDYDNLDRVTRRTFPDNTSIDYTWDNVRLTAISGVIDAFVYGDNGLLEEIRYANGVREARRYDGRLRLSEQVTSGPGGADLMRRGYGYDKVGNVLEVQDNLPGPAGVSAEARYRYDPLGRLVEAHLDPGREGFDELLAMEVDDIDNIVSKVSSRGEQSAAHVGRYAYGGAQPHAVTRAGAMGMVYDGAGQMVQRGGQALTWDAFGRLEAVTEGGRELLRNTYGVGLERILKEHDGRTDWMVSDDFEIRDGVASIHIVDGPRRLARIDTLTLAPLVLSDLAPLSREGQSLVPDPDVEITVADAWVSHAASAGLVDVELDGERPSAPSALLEAAVARLLTQEGEVTFFHNDQTGVALATNSAGEAIGGAIYHPFGQERGAWGSVGDHGYANKARDKEIGTIDYGARHLDPWLGRWLSPDPAFKALGGPDIQFVAEETGAYVAMINNPTSSRDGDGRVVDLLADAVNHVTGAIVGGVVGFTAGAKDYFQESRIQGADLWSSAGSALIGGLIQGGVGAAFGATSGLVGAAVDIATGTVQELTSSATRNASEQSKLTSRRVASALTIFAISVAIGVATVATGGVALGVLGLIGATAVVGAKLWAIKKAHTNGLSKALFRKFGINRLTRMMGKAPETIFDAGELASLTGPDSNAGDVGGFSTNADGDVLTHRKPRSKPNFKMKPKSRLIGKAR